MERAQPQLLLHSGIVVDLPAGETWVLGRTTGADLSVDVNLARFDVARTVSRWHACLRRNGPEFTLEDLGSLNKTRVNRRSLAQGQPYALNDGDQIEIGAVRLILILRRDDARPPR